MKKNFFNFHSKILGFFHSFSYQFVKICELEQPFYLQFATHLSTHRFFFALHRILSHYKWTCNPILKSPKLWSQFVTHMLPIQFIWEFQVTNWITNLGLFKMGLNVHLFCDKILCNAKKNFCALRFVAHCK